jgi:hypothetical protein
MIRNFRALCHAKISDVRISPGLTFNIIKMIVEKLFLASQD